MPLRSVRCSTKFWRAWIPYLSRFYRVLRLDLCLTIGKVDRYLVHDVVVVELTETCDCSFNVCLVCVYLLLVFRKCGIVLI